MRKSKIKTGLVISAVTLLLCCGGLEMIARLWEDNLAQGDLGWTLVASRRLPLVAHGSSDKLYARLQPNTDSNWHGIPVHIGSQGFRTEEFSNPKPSDTFRILNIGDSVTFGWEVNQADTYGKQLEQLLNAQPQTQHAEVINAGVPGWSLVAERNFLVQAGLDYQPDVIVLDLTIVNDIFAKDSGLPKSNGLFDWLRDHTYFWPFITTEVRFILSGTIGPEAIPVLNPPRAASAYFPPDENNSIYDQGWALIREMQQAAQQRGIRFIVLAFPTAFQLNTPPHPDVPQRAFAQRAARDKVEFIDLLPIYQQACAKAGEQACQGYQNLLFADVWMHPNSYGHQLAAETLAVLFAAK